MKLQFILFIFYIVCTYNFVLSGMVFIKVCNLMIIMNVENITESSPDNQ